MSELKEKRNGTVDLMSFVFCIVLILSDFAARFDTVSFRHFTFFAEGRVAIEFFLITAGALMAASAKRHTEGTSVQCTLRFMQKRLTRILPYHFIIFAGAFAVFLYLKRNLGHWELLEKIIGTLPNLFFIQKSGLDEGELMTPEWWLAGMLWCMPVVYALILRFKGYFTRIAAPLLAVLLVGYMSYETGKLSGMDVFMYADTVSKVYVRCFAGLCGGVFAYEMACHLQRLKFNSFDKALLTLAQVIAYVLPLVYMCSDFPARFEPYVAYSFFFAVMLTFSHTALYADWLDNKLTHFFGRAVLPLYYCHMLPLMVVKAKPVKSLSLPLRLVFVLAVTAVLAVLVELVIRKITAKIKRKA